MAICTLIPVYKKEFFLNTLISLGTQRLKPDKVIFSDDSQDGFLLNDHRLQLVVSSLLPGAELVYFPGPKIGALSNIRSLISKTSDEYELFHILFDDDLIFPDFYFAHQNAFSQFHSIKCAVSFRWFISESNIPIGAPSIPISERYGDRYRLISLQLLSSSTVPYLRNWLGELSNTTFRGQSSLARIFDLTNSDIPMCGLEDIGTFVKFSDAGSLLLITDFLSGFRVSQSNNTANKQSDNFKAAVLGWIPISLFALRKGCITIEQHWQSVCNVLNTVKSFYSESDPLLVTKLESYFMTRSVDGADFTELWRFFLKGSLDIRAAYSLSDAA